MSLINDALRRANQSKKSEPSQPAGGAPMQPVNPPPGSQPSGGSRWIIALIIILLVCGGWLFWKGLPGKSGEKKVANEPVATSASSTGKTAVAELLKTNPAPVIVAPVIETPPVSDAVPVVADKPVVSNTTPPVVSNPVPVQPVLKLQGIFYRATNPGALINGISVTVGEKVYGARVLKIDKQEVTLERDGETIVLTLQR